VDLLERSRLGVIVVDAGGRIMGEYEGHARHNGQYPGDQFYKWLSDNLWNPIHCERVPVEARGDRGGYPECDDVPGFHAKDCVFLAVARKSVHSPTIYNATDSRSWWRFRHELALLGIEVVNLCPESMPDDEAVRAPKRRKRSAGS